MHGEGQSQVAKSVGGSSSVGRDRRAGDHPGLIRSQEGSDMGDVVRLAKPERIFLYQLVDAHGVMTVAGLAGNAVSLAHALGVDPACADGVGADIVLGVGTRQRL